MPNILIDDVVKRRKNMKIMCPNKNSVKEAYSEKIDLIVRGVSIFLGVLFSMAGLIVMITCDYIIGGFLTLVGVVFIVLARKFRRVLIKMGPLEIEAKTN
jgi:hypothetical protein